MKKGIIKIINGEIIRFLPEKEIKYKPKVKPRRINYKALKRLK